MKGIADVRGGVRRVQEDRPAPEKGQETEEDDDDRRPRAVTGGQMRVLVGGRGQRTMSPAAVGGCGVPSPESAFSTAKSAIFSTAQGKWASFSDR